MGIHVEDEKVKVQSHSNFKLVLFLHKDNKGACVPGQKVYLLR
jgi:hypothetical protein